MNKILIALDYNPSAEKIAETGFSLATAMQGEVVLLHVLAEAAYYSAYEYSPIMGFNNFIGPDPVLSGNFDEVKSGANAFLNKSKEHLGSAAIQTIVKEGDIASTIIKTATEIGADIIVLGSHSRRGLEKILMGRVAEKVLHHSSIPLFIIPTKE